MYELIKIVHRDKKSRKEGKSPFTVEYAKVVREYHRSFRAIILCPRDM
ncbi:MAG: hypothetical protein IIZ39_06200 [Blautia sp.]|nr:hypothetical protein [Blautia sp.]